MILSPLYSPPVPSFSSACVQPLLNFTLIYDTYCLSVCLPLVLFFCVSLYFTNAGWQCNNKTSSVNQIIRSLQLLFCTDFQKHTAIIKCLNEIGDDVGWVTSVHHSSSLQTKSQNILNITILVICLKYHKISLCCLTVPCYFVT